MANAGYLHDCVLNRNTSLLVSLLDHGADVNSRNEHEQTLLHSAASINYIEAIELLLNRGANVNLQDNKGCTPLHAGARHAEVVKQLLDKGASPNCKNFQCQTPLHLAVQNKNVEGVKLLISKGADINVKDNNYSTSPLYIAIVNESLDIIKILIDNGAKVNDCDVESRPPPLYIAAQSNNLPIVQLLINSGADPNIIRISPTVDCYIGYTTLHIAVDNNNEAMAKLLLDSGVDVNVTNAFGETALHCAARLDNCYVSKLLIERGADVNVKDKSGKTPLFAAVSEGCIKNVKLLLRSGAIVNTFDHYGRTPFQFLIRDFFFIYQCEEKMILLIMNGAEINTKDKNGNTALHLAVEMVCLNNAAILLDCGASRDITNCFGETPLDVSNEISVAEIFDKHSVKLECIRMIYNQEINYERLECFQKNCVEELTIMKEIKFGSHSVFSVLSKYYDPTFVKNSLLEQEISFFEDKFPIYHLILRSTFLRAKKRYNMLEEVEGYFRGSILPAEVKRKILTYLNDDDLLKIIKAVKNEEVVS